MAVCEYKIEEMRASGGEVKSIKQNELLS